ncbi:probable 2-oxoglutarate-dependent dioxygenase ANS [Tanacetum coccineum]
MEVTETPPIRVQSITQKVPPQYIQPLNLRPTNKPTINHTIPTINLSADVTTDDISSACRDWGAFHVVNHGVDVKLLDEIRKNGLCFFQDLDMEEKMKYGCEAGSAASQGYGSKMLVDDVDGGNDGVLDWRDYFDHHTFPLSRRDPSRWPHFPTSYRSNL